MADASPPDQTWIGGVYDNADYDDVIGFAHPYRRGLSPDLYVLVEPSARSPRRPSSLPLA